MAAETPIHTEIFWRKRNPHISDASLSEKCRANPEQGIRYKVYRTGINILYVMYLY